MNEGNALPHVTVDTVDGPLDLADLKGAPAVVYFYPKDDTPGCTQEAKDFTALAEAFAAAGATVIGISKDTPEKHAKFAKKHALAVRLASDTDGAACEAFGTWGEKQLYGKIYMGIERATFLFGADGRLAQAWRKVKVPGHAEAVLAAVQGALTDIAAACRSVLETAAPCAKVKRARAVARAWARGEIAWTFDTPMPDAPARPAEPELLPPNRMPKRGKGGSERGRLALLHALAHIEWSAIDLAFDAAGRFGSEFPRAFADDWLSVGADEAMHFAILDRRLRALGSRYGALPAHAGLWEAAADTTYDALARLAVVPMVLEARGLDVTPETVARFQAAGDAASARILDRIYRDEIRHVGFGTKWFLYGCAREGFMPVTHWQTLVTRHFRGGLKPPFNDSARQSAGLTRDYYAAIA